MSGPFLYLLVNFCIIRGMSMTLQNAHMPAPKRFHLISIMLHWLIAIAIFGLFISGLWMVDAINEKATKMQAFEIYQLHKSTGLTVLVLMIVRLSLRFATAIPSYANMLSAVEATFAKLGHIALYGVLFAVPLLGWAMVSASVWGLPTIWFNLFEWPHLPYFVDLAQADKKTTEDSLKFAHKWAAYGLIALVGGHITMALKHHYLDGKKILAHMSPLTKRYPNQTDTPS